MDEPCSALDPISTLAIEDLISELKASYTIVIVTHNMQQAARVSDRTAFFNLAGVGQPGKLIEYDDTAKIFSNPTREGHRGLHLGPLRLSRRLCRHGKAPLPMGGAAPFFVLSLVSCRSPLNRHVPPHIEYEFRSTAVRLRQSPLKRDSFRIS